MLNPKFSVAIWALDSGGGISGLCLAVALSKFEDIEVRLYEAAHRFREIGAGVMIWTKTWIILELMGLAEEFSKIAHAPPDGSLGVGFDYRRSDQSEDGFRFHLVEVPHGCIRFHRAQFLDVFVNNLPEHIAHFGKRLTSYSHTNSQKIELRFEDGSTSTCDLLIGCDGVKSTVRRQLYESLARDQPDLCAFVEPSWTGTIAYRGLVDSSRIPAREDGTLHNAVQRPMMYCGKSKHVVSYSIAQGNTVNVITFDSHLDKIGTPYEGPWVTECHKAELLECYAGWEREVQTLLELIDKPTKWALHALKPLPFYVKDNVALVGDSAHAMLPHQGAGAGQAIEDAYVLAQLLGSSLATKDTIRDVLKAYEAVRLPLGNNVLCGSMESGLMYEFNHPDYGEDYVRLGPAIQRQWDWVWKTHPLEDVQESLQILKERLHMRSQDRTVSC